MKVECRCFASLGEICPSGPVEVPPEATVGDLLDLLEQRYPRLQGRCFRVAVDGELAEREALLREGAEVALLPPVSGGAGDLVRLTREPIDPGRCLEAVRRPDCGAVVLFLGTVRDHTGDLSVDRLEYQAHEEMARAELERLAARVRERFPVQAVALWHRTGTLAPGEVSVAVAVAAGHRREAFEACRWAIDTLKETVPLWKREVGPGGAVWIEGDARIPSPDS